MHLLPNITNKSAKVGLIFDIFLVLKERFNNTNTLLVFYSIAKINTFLKMYTFHKNHKLVISGNPVLAVWYVNIEGVQLTKLKSSIYEKTS